MSTPDKDGKILHTLALLTDLRGNYYYIPANIESEFQTWVSTGQEYGSTEFDDYRADGEVAKLMFLPRRSAN
jgi:hypothetical protein